MWYGLLVNAFTSAGFWRLTSCFAFACPCTMILARCFTVFILATLNWNKNRIYLVFESMNKKFWNRYLPSIEKNSRSASANSKWIAIKATTTKKTTLKFMLKLMFAQKIGLKVFIRVLSLETFSLWLICSV